MVQESAESPEDPDRSAGSAPETLHELGRYGGYGLTLGAATALFTWLGNLLDGRVHTTPVFTIVGALAGFAGGFYAMYRDLVLRPAAEARSRRETDDEEGRGTGETRDGTESLRGGEVEGAGDEARSGDG